MKPTFGTRPGQCFAANGRVRGCGGPASTTNYDPWYCEYINRTFFTGDDEETYQGTYVDLMDCNQGVVGVYNVLDSVTTMPDGTGATSLPTAEEYRVYTSYEYDDTRWGRFLRPSRLPTSIANDYLSLTIKIQWATLNKRVTALNIYVAQLPTSSTVWTSPYFIMRIPISGDGATGWEWNPGGGDGRGFFKRTTDETIEKTDWQNRGGTYYSRTGRVTSAGPEEIVHWQYTEVVNGRRFFANFYDPANDITETDMIRFTPIDSNGNSCYDVVPTFDAYYTFPVATGDPGSITSTKLAPK